MATGRATRALWAFGLSVATGVVVTTVVRRPPGLSPVGFTAGVCLLSFLALATLLWHRHEEWERLGPSLGFALYFGSLFVGVVSLAAPVGVLLGEGVLTTGVQLLGSALAFVATAWLCFDGGAKTVVTWAAPRLGIEL